MDEALIIGGTRFIGRFLLEDLIERGYDVTLFTRGNTALPSDGVSHVVGDRTDEGDLERAREAVDPDLVIDMVAYFPEEVRAALRIFGEGARYVFVSSTAAYGLMEPYTNRPIAFPRREGETPLLPCTDEQAREDTMETYGNRKAECDRIVFEAAEEGIDALSVRPTTVFGPYDHTERFDYWIDRVARYDRIVLPGDPRAMPQHLGYVEDVARGIRVAAEEGEPGEAYNAADRYHFTLAEMVGLIADALDTSVTVLHAPDRELAAAGLAFDDFVLCRHPYLVATGKLAALGWDSTPYEESVARTVAQHRESDRDGSEHDPGREAEERVLDTFAGGTRLIDGTGDG